MAISFITAMTATETPRIATARRGRVNWQRSSGASGSATIQRISMFHDV